jgi:hypothetical protein
MSSGAKVVPREREDLNRSTLCCRLCRDPRAEGLRPERAGVALDCTGSPGAVL